MTQKRGIITSAAFLAVFLLAGFGWYFWTLRPFTRSQTVGTALLSTHFPVCDAGLADFLEPSALVTLWQNYDDLEPRFHCSLLKTVGLLANSTVDVRFVEQRIVEAARASNVHMIAGSGGMQRNVAMDYHAALEGGIEALGVMAQRSIPGAMDALLRTADPDYWRVLGFSMSANEYEERFPYSGARRAPAYALGCLRAIDRDVYQERLKLALPKLGLGHTTILMERDVKDQEYFLHLTTQPTMCDSAASATKRFVRHGRRSCDDRFMRFRAGEFFSKEDRLTRKAIGKK